MSQFLVKCQQRCIQKLKGGLYIEKINTKLYKPNNSRGKVEINNIDYTVIKYYNLV